MTAILAMLLLFPALQVEIGSLDRLADAVVLRLVETQAVGFHQISIDEDCATVAPALPSEIEGRYRVFRRSDHASTWRAVKRIGERDLRTLGEGRPIGGLESGDLLIRDGYRPTVALRVAVGEATTSGFARLLETAIEERIKSSGLLRLSRSETADGISYASTESPTSLREIMAEEGIDVLLAVEAHRRAGRLVLLCRVISETDERDGFYSLTAALKADLALLMQHDADAGEGGGLLTLTAPMPAGLLDLAAADTDGVEGDELVALTREQVLIYKLAGRRLELSRLIDLSDLPRARFPTRTPAGQIVPIDINSDGATELLIGSNLLVGGAVIWLERDHVSFRLLDFQPIVRTTFGGRPAFLCGRFRAGEDTYEDSIFIVDPGFAVHSFADVGSTSSISRLDNAGRVLIVKTPMGQAAIWRPAGDDEPGILSRIPAGSIFGGPAGARSYLRADPAAGGFKVVVVDDSSHEGSTAAILTALDIRALSAYNPPGPSEKAVALCGEDNRGDVVLALYSWPW